MYWNAGFASTEFELWTCSFICPSPWPTCDFSSNSNCKQSPALCEIDIDLFSNNGTACSCLSYLNEQLLGRISRRNEFIEQMPEVQHDTPIPMPFIFGDGKSMSAPGGDVWMEGLVVEVEVEGTYCSRHKQQRQYNSTKS
jgi:hypothetical protein